MTAAARVAKIKLRTTPRRIAIAWIAWVHEFGPTQAPDPLPDLLRDMECDLLSLDLSSRPPSRHRRKQAPGENELLRDARFQCFFLIDLYVQVFLSFVAAMRASFRRIASILFYTDLGRIVDSELTAALQDAFEQLSTVLAVLELIETEQLRAPVLPPHLAQMAVALQSAFELARDLVSPQGQRASREQSDRSRDELETLLHRARAAAFEPSCDRNFLLILQAEAILMQDVGHYLESLGLLFKKALRDSSPPKRPGRKRSRTAARRRQSDRLLACYIAMRRALLCQER